MLPVLRTNLKNVSSKNQSLQDILKSCKYGFDILSVEPWTQGIHNTKITLLIDQGQSYPKDQRLVKRVHFYNRLNLAVILQGAPPLIANNTLEAIDNLNLLGYDFTTDDIELVGGEVRALPQSLGYYNEGEMADCSPTSLSWNPAGDPITVDPTKRYVLSYILIENGTVINRNRVVTHTGFSDPFDLAVELILYSGIDLMRQHDMYDYFDYSPRGHHSGLNGDETITITGYGPNTVPLEYEEFTPSSIDLQLVLINTFDMRDYGYEIDDALTDQLGHVDYVQEQFGGPVTIHSCGIKINTGE